MKIGHHWRKDWSRPEQLRQALLARRIVTGSGCWVTAAAKDGCYAAIRVSGKKVGIHVAALWAFKGIVPVPKRTIVTMHSCDNPPCWNPDHLLQAPQKENVLDAISKGRRKVRGQATHCRHGHALTLENTYWWEKGWVCRTCHRERERQRRAKKGHAKAMGWL